MTISIMTFSHMTLGIVGQNADNSFVLSGVMLSVMALSVGMLIAIMLSVIVLRKSV
jgi:hypothetical protein